MLVTFLIVLGTDQWTKHLVMQKIRVGEQIPVIPGFFDLTLTYNPGIAFGMLSNLPENLRLIILGFVTLVALSIVIYFLLKEYKNDIVAKVALMLIVGGAVGNIIDRIRFKMVVDFLDVYVGSYHWPAFNIADSAICIGVIMLLLKGSKKDIAP